MSNFEKYENVVLSIKIDRKKIKKGDFTYKFMAAQAKKIGKEVFIAKKWSYWWPEATARYGFKYKITEELDNGYIIKILSQTKPAWL